MRGRPRLYSDDELIQRKRNSWRKSAEKYKAQNNARKKKWLLEHPEYRKVYDKKYRQKLKDEMLSHYGSFCACCNEKHKEFLTLDHINNDGQKDSIEACGRWNIRGHIVYALLKRKNWPQGNYQVLCMNCNWAKRLGGECPHKR